MLQLAVELVAMGRVGHDFTHRKLVGDDVNGLASIALSQRLAQAGDDGQAIVDGGLGLGGHDLVALALGAALRVAQDRVLDAHVTQHAGGHLARVRARGVESILQPTQSGSRGSSRKVRSTCWYLASHPEATTKRAV